MSRFTPDQLDAFVGHRDNETWVVNVLDFETEALLGTLPRVEGGSFDFSIHNTIRSGGSLQVDEPGATAWGDIKLQPVYSFRDTRAVEHSWPIGVFIPSTPLTTYSDTGSSATVELYDKLLILHQDAVEGTFTLDAGSVVTDAVVALITGTGETKVSVVEAQDTLATPMTWEAGTTKLRIINDLLAAINYFSLGVDGRGFFTATPYVAPRYRAVEWDFRDDPATSIYSPDFQHEADGFDVPNKVICVGQAPDEETPVPVGIASNSNPESPWSFQNRRNRWIVHTETGVDATTEDTLSAIAARRLLELSQVTSTLEVEHAHIPLELNDAVSFRRDAMGVSALAVVQKFSLSMDLGAPAKTTLREVSA